MYKQLIVQIENNETKFSLARVQIHQFLTKI